MAKQSHFLISHDQLVGWIWYGQNLLFHRLGRLCYSSIIKQITAAHRRKSVCLPAEWLRSVQLYSTITQEVIKRRQCSDEVKETEKQHWNVVQGFQLLPLLLVAPWWWRWCGLQMHFFAPLPSSALHCPRVRDVRPSMASVFISANHSSFS